MRPIIPTIAAATLLTFALPVQSEPQEGSTIEVAPRMSADQWAQSVSKSLNGQLRQIEIDQYHSVPEAIIQIRFEIADGVPVNVRMVEPSGMKWLDRATLHSVAQMRGLPDMPASLEGWTVRANIISAKDSRTAQRMMRGMQHSAATQMASAESTREIVLTAGG
ncbi:energy transducer TonB [Croceicoccus mobilis]|uniref:TonB C-terminal domain-containing protein n=1 Tax=Croceicoccus mobilis TaxID=1703339 RepID=A0A916YUM2_9SPHN|nr:hypothetical protein [Croceicoccus mobilis]GGD62418.1 hypothetical protein GCM10010990_09800 [Croceicoccus mobilis]